MIIQRLMLSHCKQVSSETNKIITEHTWFNERAFAVIKIISERHINVQYLRKTVSCQWSLNIPITSTQQKARFRGYTDQVPVQNTLKIKYFGNKTI